MKSGRMCIATYSDSNFLSLVVHMLSDKGCYISERERAIGSKIGARLISNVILLVYGTIVIFAKKVICRVSQRNLEIDTIMHLL